MAELDDDIGLDAALDTLVTIPGSSPAVEPEEGTGTIIESAGSAETFSRIPLRMFLKGAGSDPGQRARMANELSGSIIGLGEDQEVVVRGRDLFVTGPGGEMTPLDPEKMGGAEFIADIFEEVGRAGPATAGAIAGAPGGPLGMAMGAFAGESARQVGETVATRNILNEESALTPEQKLFESGLAAAGEGIPVVGRGIGRGLRGAARTVQLAPTATRAEGNIAAREATGRLRADAQEQGIPHARQMRVSIGERGGPQTRKMVAQLRDLNNFPAQQQQRRGHVLYELGVNAAKEGGEDARLLRETLSEQVAQSRRDGVQLVRDLTRNADTLPPGRAMTVARERTREYIDRMNDQITPLYEQSRELLEQSGATLRYNGKNVMDVIDAGAGTRRVRVKGGGFRDIAGDLPEELQSIRDRIQIAEESGWTPHVVGDRTVTPEQQIIGMMQELGGLQSKYGSSGDRAATALSKSVRNELKGMLNDPVVGAGDPALIRQALEYRQRGSTQYAAFRSNMDRIQSAGLDSGNKAVDVFDSIVGGNGARYHDALQESPELREAVLGRLISRVEGDPTKWTEVIGSTRPEDLAMLLGDAPGTREAIVAAKRTAELAGRHEGIVETALAKESRPVRLLQKTLMSSDEGASSTAARGIRDLPPDSPGRTRAGAAILGWVIDQSKVERKGDPFFIHKGKLDKAMDTLRERGLVDLVPDDSWRLLDDMETHLSRAIGPGGLATGLTSAAGAGAAKTEIAEAVAGGKPSGVVGAIFNSMRGIGGGEAIGLLLTNPVTAGALDNMIRATSNTGRFVSQSNLLNALVRQSVASSAAETKRDASAARRAENTPAPAGL